jgi:ABC-type glycerol-3-phosphate transport system substrate-binding protein
MSRRILMLAAIAAAAAFITTAPADAAWRVIKWDITGVCQIWNFGVDGKPIPFDYRVMSRALPTFGAAVNAKERLFHAGRCTF